jgi:hypothetical protein
VRDVLRQVEPSVNLDIGWLCQDEGYDRILGPRALAAVSGGRETSKVKVFPELSQCISSEWFSRSIA